MKQVSVQHLSVFILLTRATVFCDFIRVITELCQWARAFWLHQKIVMAVSVSLQLTQVLCVVTQDL